MMMVDWPSAYFDRQPQSGAMNRSRRASGGRQYKSREPESMLSGAVKIKE